MKDLNLFKTENSIFLKKVHSKSELSKEDDSDGYLIDTKGNEKEARRIVESLKGTKKILAVFGADNEFNRRVLETLKISYLVSPELENKKDTLKQRDSGLNHVTAKIAKAKNIEIVVDVSYLSSLTPQKKAELLSRIIQNIKICRKAHCKIKFASLAKSENEISDVQGRTALGFSLGMSSQQAKESCEFVAKL